MIFQNPFTQISGVKDTVFEEVAYGLENFGVPVEEIERRVIEVMKMTNIESLAEKNPFELSGGQMQRVALASVIVLEPDILIIDEPTSQLDPEGTESVFAIIKAMKDKQKTIILVEQKIDLIAEYADDVLVLRVVRAVGAAVDAVVGEVEGSEENDAGTVDVVLHGLGRFEDAGVAVFEFAGEENGGFAVGETLEGGGLLKNRFDQGAIVLVLVGPGQRGLDLVVVDELLGLSGLGIVHGYGPQGNSNFRRSSRSNRLEKAVGGLESRVARTLGPRGLGAIGARGKAPRA